MRRIVHLLGEPAFHVLLAVFSLLLFSWLFLTRVDAEQPQILFLGLFLFWGILIFLLVAIGMSCQQADRDVEQRAEKVEENTER